jgi:hypothetical protein
VLPSVLFAEANKEKGMSRRGKKVITQVKDVFWPYVKSSMFVFKNFYAIIFL